MKRGKNNKSQKCDQWKTYHEGGGTGLGISDLDNGDLKLAINGRNATNRNRARRRNRIGDTLGGNRSHHTGNQSKSVDLHGTSLLQAREEKGRRRSVAV